MALFCSDSWLSSIPVLEKEMATHSSTLAWKIPWTEEPGKLQSMGLRRVGHNWATSLSLSSTGEGNGKALQCSFQENSRDRGAWWAAVYGVAQSRTQLKWLSSSSSSSSIPVQRCTTWSSFSCQWISWLNLLQWKGKKEEWGFFSLS